MCSQGWAPGHPSCPGPEQPSTGHPGRFGDVLAAPEASAHDVSPTGWTVTFLAEETWVGSSLAALFYREGAFMGAGDALAMLQPGPTPGRDTPGPRPHPSTPCRSLGCPPLCRCRAPRAKARRKWVPGVLPLGHWATVLRGESGWCRGHLSSLRGSGLWCQPHAGAVAPGKPGRPLSEGMLALVAQGAPARQAEGRGLCLPGRGLTVALETGIMKSGV